MSSTRELLCMCDLCRKRAAAYARTEAFAAIRRAVEFARSCDQFATELEDDQRPDTWLIPCQLWCAETIRNAIRAAIGSEKA